VTAAGEPEDWLRIHSGNVHGTFVCAQAALRRMTRDRSGSIVLISSLAGRADGLYAGVDYAASKGGVIAPSKALAKQVIGTGVRVNCIVPGAIDTPMTRE
jgi:3-oxoacyl-[acyl-carrier protein] reductase